MGGLLTAALVALLVLAGPAAAVGDLVRSETHARMGADERDIVVQVHCGGPLSGHSVEVYDGGTPVTTAATGDEERHSGRTAVGDITGDGRINDGEYGSCTALTAMRQATIATSIVAGQQKTAIKDFACATQTLRDLPAGQAEPTSFAPMAKCGGPGSVEANWDSRRKAVDDRFADDPVKQNTPEDVRDVPPMVEDLLP